MAPVRVVDVSQNRSEIRGIVNGVLRGLDRFWCCGAFLSRESHMACSTTTSSILQTHRQSRRRSTHLVRHRLSQLPFEKRSWPDSGSQAATRQTHARDASPSEQGKATAGQPSQRWSQKTRWLAPRRPCVANTIRSTLSFSASRTI